MLRAKFHAFPIKNDTFKRVWEISRFWASVYTCFYSTCFVVCLDEILQPIFLKCCAQVRHTWRSIFMCCQAHTSTRSIDLNQKHYFTFLIENYISSESTFRKFCTQVHHWWHYNILAVSGRYRYKGWTKIFFAFSIKIIHLTNRFFFQFWKQVHWQWQCNIQVVSEPCLNSERAQEQNENSKICEHSFKFLIKITYLTNRPNLAYKSIVYDNVYSMHYILH